jgi:hypothetical protein
MRGVRRVRIRGVALLALVALTGCSLLVSTSDLSGGATNDAGQVSPHADGAADSAIVTPDASIEEGAGHDGSVFPGNGHSYQLVPVPSGVSWTTARAAAEAAGGHLATIGSAEESDFVIALATAQGRTYFTSRDVGPWLGGYQPNPTAALEPAGGWAWVDGTPWSFTMWHAGQPDDDGNESYLDVFWRDGVLGWNDSADAPSPQVMAYIVEFD